MAARFSVLLDACSLVPVVLADTLLRLAETGLYRPLWSQKIMEETVAAIEEIHPQLHESGGARRRAAAMDLAFEDASVSGWGDLVSGLELPDEDDRHVLAAAIQGQADLIVTSNLKDFPARVLSSHEIEAQSPDEFLMNQLELDPDRTMEALRRQAESAKHPPLSMEDVLERLARCGAERFAQTARGQLWRAR